MCDPDVATPGATVTWRMIWNLSLPGPFSSSFEKDAALLTSIGRRRGETSRHWRQTPFFNIRFDEDEATLPKIDVYSTRAISTHSRKEILGLQAMSNIIKLLTVTSEEEAAGSWAVANANHIALNEFRTVIGGVEGLVVASLTSRGVSY